MPFLAAHARNLLENDYVEEKPRKQKENSVRDGMVDILGTHKQLLSLNETLTRVSCEVPANEGERTRVDEELQGRLSELKRRQESLRCLPSLYEITGDDFLKVTFLNARSLHKHFVDEASDYDLPATDVGFYAETRFSIFDRNDEFLIDNFRLFRNDAPTSTPEQGPHHGTAVFTCNNYTHAQSYSQAFNVNGVEITLVKLVQFPFLVVVSL